MAQSSKKIFVKLPQFVQKILSKTTEVKSIATQIQTLNTQKVQLEANNQSTTQVQTQLTKKENTLAKKVVKVETKINTIVKTAIETKVLQSLGSIGEIESGYDVILMSTIVSREISFNSSPYYRMNISNGFGDGYIFTFGANTGISYFKDRFVLFKGQAAIDYANTNFQFANTSDSRGYYQFFTYNGATVGGVFRKNWLKYKRSNTWCLYDALNDIMYYSNYSGSYIPTKKWYRADILYKTEIELKIRSISSGGSSSGSTGSSGSSAGNSIGINLLDEFIS